MIKTLLDVSTDIDNLILSHFDASNEGGCLVYNCSNLDWTFNDKGGVLFRLGSDGEFCQHLSEDDFDSIDIVEKDDLVGIFTSIEKPYFTLAHLWVFSKEMERNNV